MAQPEPPPPPNDRLPNERVDPVDFERWKSEFAAVGWSKLIPFRNWVTDRPWTLLWVQFISFAFGFPFLLICYYRDSESSLAEAAWAFGIYFSIIWAALIHRCIRPGPIGLQRIVGTWAFSSLLGVAAVIVLSLIGQILPIVRDVFAARESVSIVGKLVGMTLAVGVIEETAKLMPILWFVRRFDQAPRPTTVAYLGVISGLAFGATEAVLYSAMYASGHAASQIGYGDYLIVQLLRLVCLPFLHGIWAGISGYFVGLSARNQKTRRVMIVTGLLGVSVLHGCYNTFADGWLGFLIAMLSLAVFIGYVRDEGSAIDAVSQRVVEQGNPREPPILNR